MSVDSYVWIIIVMTFGLLGIFLERFKNNAFYICLLFGLITAIISVFILT